MAYFVYKNKTTGEVVFGCEAESLEDADGQYENAKGIAPVKQTHIGFPENHFDAYQEYICNCLNS
jgi:hypothetical protein